MDSQAIFFCQVSNARFYRFPVGQISQIINRHGASTSMYSLTFRVRVTTPPAVWTKWNDARSRRVDFIAGDGSLRRHAQCACAACVQRAVGLVDYRWALPCISICMYVCMRAFITRRSYSLSSHECTPVGQTEKTCLQNNVSVRVGSRSDGGREFHSFGAQAAKLRGPKLPKRRQKHARAMR